jgi:hypothetical protein
MSDWQDVFVRNSAQDDLGSDFEDRVFAKIKKKKRQRKIGYVVTAIAAIFLLLSLFQLFRPDSRHAQVPGTDGGKEEIPVSENLYFSAFDNRTQYSLEPVSLRKKPPAREEVLNQI